MRIGYLTYNMDSKTGWGRYASDLINSVQDAGHETIILKEVDDERGGDVVLGRGGRVFSSALAVVRHLQSCDIIHALDGYPYSIIAALANLWLRKPLVITAVGSYAVAPLYNWPTGMLLRWAYQQASAVIAISNFTRQEILKKIAPDGIKTITPGIDLARFKQEHRESPERFILSVGALKYRKGYHVSIPAFAAARKGIPDLKYIIVGGQEDTVYFKELHDHAVRYGVQDDVQFLADVSDTELRGLYGGAQLFILTSVNEGHHFEGFGIVFLEAAAAGLPVVGTADNGIADAVAHGRNGFLVPQGDVGATAEAITQILSDRMLWEHMSNESRTWAEEHSLPDVTQRYLDIYRAVANRSS